jgi:hypothetical protein
MPFKFHRRWSWHSFQQLPWLKQLNLMAVQTHDQAEGVIGVSIAPYELIEPQNLERGR